MYDYVVDITHISDLLLPKSKSYIGTMFVQKLKPIAKKYTPTLIGYILVLIKVKISFNFVHFHH